MKDLAAPCSGRTTSRRGLAQDSPNPRPSDIVDNGKPLGAGKRYLHNCCGFRFRTAKYFFRQCSETLDLSSNSAQAALKMSCSVLSFVGSLFCNRAQHAELLAI